jgi:hypothetical protein
MDSSTEQLIHERFSTIAVSNGAETIARFIVRLVEGNQ